MSDEVRPATDEEVARYEDPALYPPDRDGELEVGELPRLLARIRAERERARIAEAWAQGAEERAMAAEADRQRLLARLRQAEEERDRLRGQAMKAARHCALGCRHCVDVTLEHEA